MSTESSGDAVPRPMPFEPTRPLEFRPIDDADRSDRHTIFEPDGDVTSIRPGPDAPSLFSSEPHDARRRPVTPLAPAERGAVSGPNTWIMATVALVVVLAATFLGLFALFNAAAPTGPSVHVEVRTETTIR